MLPAVSLSVADAVGQDRRCGAPELQQTASRLRAASFRANLRADARMVVIGLAKIQ
jgi:hypothetical protein